MRHDRVMTDLLAPTAPPALGRRRRMAAPAWTIGSLAAATLALHLRDPHQHASWGLCPLAAVGVWCPGCGGLRAVNDLSNGHPLEAASSNLAFMVALPFVLVGLAVWTLDRWRGTSRRVPPVVVRGTATVAVVLLAVFTVLRNLPVGAWLAP
jgi:hypothetical protein